MTRAEILKAYPNASESFIKHNLGDGSFASVPVKLVNEAMRQHMVGNEQRLERLDVNAVQRPNKDIDDLNKTERLRYHYLQMLKVPNLRVQAITLKLANNCRYTADFTYVDENGRMVFEDVKGTTKNKSTGQPTYWAEEDSKLKMKFAARSYPEFRFLIVFKHKDQWILNEVEI